MSGTIPTISQQPLESSVDQPSDPSNDLLNIDTNEEYVGRKDSKIKLI